MTYFYIWLNSILVIESFKETSRGLNYKTNQDIKEVVLYSNNQISITIQTQEMVWNMVIGIWTIRKEIVAS